MCDNSSDLSCTISAKSVQLKSPPPFNYFLIARHTYNLAQVNSRGRMAGFQNLSNGAILGLNHFNSVVIIGVRPGVRSGQWFLIRSFRVLK